MNHFYHRIFDMAGAVMMISAVLLAFLPPYEAFAEWPRFQSAYKFFMIFLWRFGHVNVRSLIYPSINNKRTNGGNNASKPN